MSPPVPFGFFRVKLADEVSERIAGQAALLHRLPEVRPR